MFSLGNPSASYIARFNGLSLFDIFFPLFLGNNVPGLYAAKVVGELPESVIDLLQSHRGK